MTVKKLLPTFLKYHFFMTFDTEVKYNLFINHVVKTPFLSQYD